MVTITMTREEFRELFQEKAVDADISPTKMFATAINRICEEHDIDVYTTNFLLHTIAFSASMTMLLHELEIGIFGKEEGNR